MVPEEVCKQHRPRIVTLTYVDVQVRCATCKRYGVLKRADLIETGWKKIEWESQNVQEK